MSFLLIMTVSREMCRVVQKVMQSSRSGGGKKLQARTKTNDDDAERIREGNTEMREREEKKVHRRTNQIALR